MNPAPIIRRLVRILAAVLAAGLACAVAPAALATPRPLPPGWNKHPPLPASAPTPLRFRPGWNKHPPLSTHAHTVAATGLPGWQVALIVVLAALLATAVAVAYRLRVSRRRISATPA